LIETLQSRNQLTRTAPGGIISRQNGYILGYDCWFEASSNVTHRLIKIMIQALVFAHTAHE